MTTLFLWGTTPIPVQSVSAPATPLLKSRSSKAQRNVKLPMTGAGKISSVSVSGGLSGLDVDVTLSTLPLTILQEEIYSVQLPVSPLPSVTPTRDLEKGMWTASSFTSDLAGSRVEDTSLELCESPESEEESDLHLELESEFKAKPEYQRPPLLRKFSMHHMSDIFREIVQHTPLTAPFTIPEKDIEDEVDAEIFVKDRDKEQKKSRSISRKNSIVDETSSPGSNTPGISPLSPRVVTRKDSKGKAIVQAGKCEKESVEEM